jgi:hypothetical protein
MFIFIALIILVVGIVVFLYYSYKSSTQEKSVIKLLVQNYVFCFRRFSTVYEQILQGEIDQTEQDFLNKSEAHGDSFELESSKPLVRVIRDKSIYQKIIKLNGYFSQIKEWEKTISLSDFQSSESMTDTRYVTMMLQSFLEDIDPQDDSLYRYEIGEYIEDINTILDYLDRTNTRPLFRSIAFLSSRFKKDMAELHSFIRARRSEVESLRWRLEKLRLLGERYLIEQDKSSASGPNAQLEFN